MLRKLFSKSTTSPEITCSMTSAKAIAGPELDRLRTRMQELGPWFHNFEIARDVWTNPGGGFPGADYPAVRWQHVRPWMGDLSGKSCLDVGCSSGFFSLKAKELGASSVLGVDSGEQIRAIEQARYAAEVLALPATFDTISAYDLARLDQRFDTVFFFGVFYHLRHPLVALEAIRAVCTGSLFFQTITTPNGRKNQELDRRVTDNVQFNSREMLDDRFPSMQFVEGQLAGDASCWFIPNVQAVAAMLRACGFVPQEFIYPNDQEVIVRCTVA